MFKKLRMQFVAIVMVSVAIVLVVVFSGICIVDYNRSMGEVEQALSESIDRASDGYGRQGGFVGSMDHRRPGEFVEDMMEDDFGGPRIGGMQGGRAIVPVAVYTIASDASYTIVGEFATAQIDADVLSEAAAIVNGIGDGTGTLGELGLHYEKRTTGQATYVAFADTSTTSNWKNIALSLAIAMVGILAVFFLLSLLLSNWVLKPVREAWDSQKQFVADASHELKTPLTVILANNSILLKHPEDSIASQSQWIESSQVEAENMQGLVNEMLQLAQVEARASLNLVPLDFSYLVDGICLQFESVAFERGCAFDTDITEGITVNGDSASLKKAVSTLLENALKYVDESGMVTVRLVASGRTARLSIRNTGSVISSEDIAHIFDRFYRTDKARTSGAGGYGLGLAIARGIANEHNGDITCTSTPEEGTTFTVTLPIA